VGYITKLPVREEKKAVEGGVERLLHRTDLDRQGKWHYLEPKQLRKETEQQPFKLTLTTELWNTLTKLDRHSLEAVRTRMKQICDRPSEMGEEKHGMFKGLKTVKFENQSYVLMFKVDEQNRTVKFLRYAHHNVAYSSVPDVEHMQFVELAVLAQRR